MEGVLTDVFVHAVWIDVGSDEGIVWLSGDIVGLTNIEVNEIRRRIKAEPELSKCVGINFSCTHSHSGIDTVGYWGKANALKIPSDGKDEAYMEKLFSQSVKAAKEAFANRTPGKLYTGRHSIEGGLFTKRRLPDKHEVLTRIRFVPDDGSAETWLINVGAHPNSLGGANRMLSGEYPYFLRQRVAEKAGANVLFGIGAIGGMDAAEFDADDKVNNIKMQGEFFADAAIAVDNDKLLEPVIKTNTRQFYLPVDNYVLLLLAMKGTMSFNPFPCKESDTGIAMRTEMTYMTFGSQKILLLPAKTSCARFTADMSLPNAPRPERDPKSTPRRLPKSAATAKLSNTASPTTWRAMSLRPTISASIPRRRSSTRRTMFSAQGITTRQTRWASKRSRS